jgi:hypothetical protein
MMSNFRYPLITTEKRIGKKTPAAIKLRKIRQTGEDLKSKNREKKF